MCTCGCVLCVGVLCVWMYMYVVCVHLVYIVRGSLCNMCVVCGECVCVHVCVHVCCVGVCCLCVYMCVWYACSVCGGWVCVHVVSECVVCVYTCMCVVGSVVYVM